FDQLDRLVEAAAEQALLRRAGGVTHEKSVLRLLETRPVVDDVPQQEVGQEPPDVVRRVGQAAAVEVDQRGPARGDPDVFDFEVPCVKVGGSWGSRACTSCARSRSAPIAPRTDGSSKGM